MSLNQIIPGDTWPEEGQWQPEQHETVVETTMPPVQPAAPGLKNNDWFAQVQEDDEWPSKPTNFTENISWA